MPIPTKIGRGQHADPVDDTTRRRYLEQVSHGKRKRWEDPIPQSHMEELQPGSRRVWGMHLVLEA